MARRHINKTSAIAIRPVFASETRVGQTNEGTGENDDAQRCESCSADDSVGLS